MEIERRLLEHVYEPREDTFLFMDALEQDVEFIKERAPKVCLEVGPGSGVMLAHLSELLKEKEDVGFFGCDVNADAVAATLDTFARNSKGRGHRIECAQGDMCSAFAEQLAGKVDILLFNPPYVPTEEEEVGHGDIRAAWAGGADGMEVTRRFLEEWVPKMLAPQGACYVVFVQENDPLGVAKRLAAHFGLMPKQILRRTAKNEKLSVWRFTWRQKDKKPLY